MHVPNELVEEFADLRSAYARLLLSYEKELSKTPEAKNEFVSHVQKLFPKEMSSCHNFQSIYNKLASCVISLFNTCYLRIICKHLQISEEIR